MSRLRERLRRVIRKIRNLREVKDDLNEAIRRRRKRRDEKRSKRERLNERAAELKELAEAYPDDAAIYIESRERVLAELERTRSRIEKLTARIRRASHRLDRVKARLEELTPRRRRLHRKLDALTSGGPQKAVDWARSKVGITESPAGSNWGPEIGAWIKYTGYSGPVFWCGCFVCYAVVAVAGANIPSRIRLGFDGYINADAANGTNGLRRVFLADAQPGDIVTFNFNHIALFLDYSAGYVTTVDGNTSSTSGTDNNGGGVFIKRRSISYIVAVARPTY